MDATKAEKLKRFANDRVMFEAVRDQLTEYFMKDRKESDVQTLAAQMLAVTFLREGLRDIERLARKRENEERDKVNPAL